MDDCPDYKIHPWFSARLSRRLALTTGITSSGCLSAVWKELVTSTANPMEPSMGRTSRCLVADDSISSPDTCSWAQAYPGHGTFSAGIAVEE